MPAAALGVPTYLAVRNLETLNWRLMLAIPRTELLADARALLRRQLLLGALGLAGLIAAIYLVAAGISRPIRALAHSVDEVRGEQFDFTLPEDERRDEIGVLTGALRRMRDALKQHIQLRAESLAAEKRLEHELAFAASIQQSMLPAHDRELPAAARVHAALVPAKRVGGDLYDYFTVRNDELLFVVGDVSDKGIPAALCMARLSSLLRLLGSTAESPDRLLSEVNARFGERNEACMFATIGCGFLDLRTGRLRYASAGHEPPLLREAGGRLRQIDVLSGPAIGVEAQADYALSECHLAPGDTVVLFTDGVTEAAADDGSLFGIERLQDLLREAGTVHDAGELVQHITRALTAHRTRFHATDDLTVLTVCLLPPGITSQMTEHGTRWVVDTPATAEGIQQTRKWLHAILAARDVSAVQISEAELVAEELLTNVVKAARSGASVQISMACEVTADEVVMTVRDDGAPFNPLTRARPDLDADIANREVGGLGIHMVQELAKACCYQHSSGCNELEIRLHRTA
jgi:sigma-B regulation protein RsbU (phosphoserine phosphatase)